jgi:DNA-methyltransferase (dcm)
MRKSERGEKDRGKRGAVGLFSVVQDRGDAPYFIDLFAGCGGLSLGLCLAGWRGLFAVERAEDAFATFKANFIETGSRFRFDWEAWLPVEPLSIERVLKEHRADVARLRGRVGLVAGGPPCQGFSFAGRRSAADPRNRMFEKYVEFVEIVRPRLLVLENVPGMDVAHNGGRQARRKTYYQKLVERLDEIGYSALGAPMDASEFGVAQRRRRLVVIGVSRDGVSRERADEAVERMLAGVKGVGRKQLEQLNGGMVVSAVQAISDLEAGEGALLEECMDPPSPRGYRQVQYAGPKTAYQRELNGGVTFMDSMRLARHREEVMERFRLILEETKERRGKNLSQELREKIGTSRKHRVVPMDPNAPAPTITTLPDDMLHYREPRILTVRECARLQSFPDWFVFKGKYTTGGGKRKVECPRYTQVGNAVPPLLGRAIGVVLLQFLEEFAQ